MTNKDDTQEKKESIDNVNGQKKKARRTLNFLYCDLHKVHHPRGSECPTCAMASPSGGTLDPHRHDDSPT